MGGLIGGGVGEGGGGMHGDDIGVVELAEGLAFAEEAGDDIGLLGDDVWFEGFDGDGGIGVGIEATVDVAHGTFADEVCGGVGDLITAVNGYHSRRRIPRNECLGEGERV